jgi:2-aminoadipate transaminase
MRDPAFSGVAFKTFALASCRKGTMTMTLRTARRMSSPIPNAVGELLRMGADPAIISFAGGYPDATLFPTGALRDVYAQVVGRDGATALQYTVSDGEPKLREQVAARLTQAGTACGMDSILMLQGSQQGLDLMGKLMLDRGDVVITERPTFLGAPLALNPFEPRYRSVRMDADGMDVDHLEHVLKEEPGTKFIYTIPDFQNPTGVSMSWQRRRELIALANRFDVLVLEDTAYREVRFQGEAPPTIKSLDTEGRVVLLGSFSKILSPGMRLGYAMANPDIIAKLGGLKLAADTQVSTVNMRAASLYLEQHDINAHIEILRDAYRRKKNLMLGLIRQHFPQDVAATDPEGGLFTWLSFPKTFNTEDFMRNHALPRAKVAYVPGAPFFSESPEHNHARFNYSGQSDERIEQGMMALAKVLKAELARKG